MMPIIRKRITVELNGLEFECLKSRIEESSKDAEFYDDAAAITTVATAREAFEKIDAAWQKAPEIQKWEVTNDDILVELAELKRELYRSGWGVGVDHDLAHVRDVLDKLIQILEVQYASEVDRG